jgi:hypothetical protein
MQLGDYHSFPTSVDAFAGPENLSVEFGSDGTMASHIRIPGSYGSGGEGYFHYIVDATDTLTHRLFEPF